MSKKIRIAYKKDLHVNLIISTLFSFLLLKELRGFIFLLRVFIQSYNSVSLIANLSYFNFFERIFL